MKEKWPESKIIFLTFEANKGLYDDIKYIEKKYYFNMNRALDFVWDSIRLYFWALFYRFDLVFDYEFASKLTAIFSFLIFPQNSVGFSPTGSWKDVFDLTIQYNEVTHISKIFLRPLMGINSSIVVPLVPIFTKETKQVFFRYK